MTATPTRRAEPLVIRKRRSAPRPAAPLSVLPDPPRVARAAQASEPDHLPDVVAIASRAGRRLRRPGLKLWTATNQAVAAVVCWCVLAGIVYALDPTDPTARLAFFVALAGAIFFTLSPIIRAVSLQFSNSRLYQEAVGVQAARQALMVSAFVTVNLFLQMNRNWNGLMALLLLGAFAVIEIVLLARR